MTHPLGERGFSLIGLLMTVVIVCILLTMSLQTYSPIMQGANSGTGTSPLSMDLSKTRIREVFTAEQLYYSLHRSYATWPELVRDGQIPGGYTNKAQGAGTPFVPGHDVEIEVTQHGFVVTATPNAAAGALPGSPILKIDQDGKLEEVPT